MGVGVARHLKSPDHQPHPSSRRGAPVIETDDLIYRVDNHYLGPTGKTLPVPIRYPPWAWA
ncbi:hypothetical protein GCM10020255_008430 [Rhodococcus baikonurensis]